MALLLRLLLGIPMFAALCGLCYLLVALAVQTTGLDHLVISGLAAFFAFLAYAIWHILIFRSGRSIFNPRFRHGGNDDAPGTGPTRPPDAGKPSPLLPTGPHHLSAARKLPLSEDSYYAAGHRLKP